jgi:hypothetical protein
MRIRSGDKKLVAKNRNGLDIIRFGGFGPTDISGCVLWLQSDLAWQDAAKTVPCINSSLIYTGEDKSGNGNDEIQGTEARRPVYLTNQIVGYPAWAFDGIDDVLDGSFTLNRPVTLFMVYKHVVIGAPVVSDTVLVGPGGAFSGLFVCSPPPNTSLFNFATSYDGCVANGVYAVVSFLASNGNSFIWENAVQRATGVGAGGDFGGIRIGALNEIGSRATNIHVAELVVYNSALSDPNRLLVENYLNGRYAIY